MIRPDKPVCRSHKSRHSTALMGLGSHGPIILASGYPADDKKSDRAHHRIRNVRRPSRTVLRSHWGRGIDL